MKAIIPVAGYATRLHPLTKNKPKALIEVKGAPILTHIVGKISALPEVDQIYVVTNSKFFYNFEDWAKEVESKVPIKVINDNTESNDDRLGQMGDINLALEKENVDDDILVISGDNLFSLSLEGMHADLKSRNAPTILLYDVKDKEEAKRMGVVELGEGEKVASFEEKPANPKSTLCSCGIYFFPRETVGVRELVLRVAERLNAEIKAHRHHYLFVDERFFIVHLGGNKHVGCRCLAGRGAAVGVRRLLARGHGSRGGGVGG